MSDDEARIALKHTPWKPRSTAGWLLVVPLTFIVWPGGSPLVLAAPGDPTEVQILERRISASSDDAEESEIGSVSLTSTDLELGADGGRPQTVGLRFAGLSIPPGATVVRAYVQFQVDESRAGATSLLVEGEASDDALAFTGIPGNISSRPRTGAAVTWSPRPWIVVGRAGPPQRTPDIATVIDAIVHRSGWSLGNAIALFITGSGERVAESFDGLAEAAPLLHVEYLTHGANTPPTISDIADQTTVENRRTGPIRFTVGDAETRVPDLMVTGSSSNTTLVPDANIAFLGRGRNRQLRLTPAPGESGSTTITVTVTDEGGLTAVDRFVLTVTPAGARLVERRVSASSDDAEESPFGSVNLTSNDLELVFDTGGNQTVGMRFADVAIPPGATILDAYIQFQVDETSSGAAELLIQGEAADNAATFTTFPSSISARPRTLAGVHWSPSIWAAPGQAGPAQRTPNIASVIQEIVQLPGWSEVNAVVLIVTGFGKRTAEAYDGLPQGAPLLHIELVP